MGISSGGSGCEEGDVEAGTDNERSAEEHREGGELMKCEEGNDGAGDELGVVVLGDIGGCG